MTNPTCTDTFITKKRDLKNDYYSITFSEYNRAKDCHPGHFVHILLPKSEIPFRRAFSVASVDSEKKEVEIIFKIFGRGTRILGNLHKGDKVNLLGPLGTKFDFPKKNERTIIVAGGIGFPPLLFLAKAMVDKGYEPKSIEFFYGGRTALDILDITRIKKLGVRFHPVTEDGSLGLKGLVTEPVEELINNHKSDSLRLYSCGPEPMLKAVDALGVKYSVPGQISVEAPMPCGVGICLGCVVNLTAGGHARVCREGPVFEIGEVAL